MAVPNIFAAATGSIPLSQLDANFNTAITLGNTAVYLGNTTTTFGNVTLTNPVLTDVNGLTGNGIRPGFKNRIINGGMAIDQRNAGAAQTITAAAALAYTVDRWYAWTTGANGTTQRVAGTAPSQYALKFTGATSNTLCGIAQRIEQLNSYDLASGAITISAYMTASTNTTITAVLNGPSTTADTFGTIASPTVTQIATTTFSVTTSRTLFTWTISAATMSGFNKGLELIFKAASGLGNGVTWTVEQVQLEAGSTATSFDARPFGTELELCRRYYQKSFELGTVPSDNSTNNTIIGGQWASTGGSGTASGTSYATAKVFLSPEMRTAPGITLYQPNGTGATAGRFGDVTSPSGSTTVTAATNKIMSNFFDVSANGGNGLTDYGNAVGVNWTASAEL